MSCMLLLVSLMAGLAEANPEKTFILPGGAEIEMVWIEPGTFVMGSDVWYDAELHGQTTVNRPDPRPAHQVTLTKGFWMGKYEVTVRQWEGVANADLPENFVFPGEREWRISREQVNEELNAVTKRGDDFPVIGTRWIGISLFTAKLNQIKGDSPWRLPTEAEWEYACRAGTTTKWFWGDNAESYESYMTSSVQPVGQRFPNAWGLYDMLGNAGEWCQDWYAPYPSEPQTDPLQTVPTPENWGGTTCIGDDAPGFRGCDTKVFRGVHSDYSVGDAPKFVYIVRRSSLDPRLHGNVVGLRLVCDESDPPTSVTPDTWGQIKRAYSTP